MDQKTLGPTDGIDYWKRVTFSYHSKGTACFCCHEPLGAYGSKTRREDQPNRICMACTVQWSEMPEKSLFELPRHRVLPKGELFVDTQPVA